MDLSQIIKQLAEKHKLTISATKQIVESQFSFVQTNMRQRTEKNIILPILGKFAIKPNRLRIMHERIAAKQTSGNTPRLEEPGIQNT